MSPETAATAIAVRSGANQAAGVEDTSIVVEHDAEHGGAREQARGQTSFGTRETNKRRTQDRGGRADGDPNIGRSRALPQGGPEPGAEKKTDDEPGHDRQPVCPDSLVDGLSDGIDRLAGLPGGGGEIPLIASQERAETHAFSRIVQPSLPLRRIGRFEQM